MRKRAAANVALYRRIRGTIKVPMFTISRRHLGGMPPPGGRRCSTSSRTGRNAVALAYRLARSSATQTLRLGGFCLERRTTSPWMGAGSRQPLARSWRPAVSAWGFRRSGARRSSSFRRAISVMTAPSMTSAEGRLRELGIQLPAPPEPFGAYAEAVQTGNLLFVSGMLPTEGRSAKIHRLGSARTRYEAGASGSPRRAQCARCRPSAPGIARQGHPDRPARRFGGNVGDVRDQPKIADARVGAAAGRIRTRQEPVPSGLWCRQPPARRSGRAGTDLRGVRLMSASWNRNRLTERLGIDYPIIQGPLGGLSSQKLTAAVSNFGGLGSFGAHSLAPDAIEDVIAQIRSLTSRPFAMNLWVSMEDEGARASDEARLQPEPGAARRPPRRPGRPAPRVPAVLARPLRGPGARVARCEGAGLQLHLRHSAERDPGGVPGERHRHHRHGDDARRGGGAGAGRCGRHRRVRLRGRRASRLLPPARGGFAHGHAVAGPPGRRCASTCR